MALVMTRPTRHPKSGTFRLRLTVPADLRDTTQRLFGQRAELLENLRTRDPAEAKRLAPDALGRLQAKLHHARTVATNKPAHPSSREIAALAGQFYRRRIGADGNDEDLHWDITLELFGSEPAFPDADASAAVDVDPLNEQRAESLLAKHGFSTDPAAVRRLAAAIARADLAFQKLVKQRLGGDWSPDVALGTFPPLTSAPPVAGPQPSFSFDDLLSGWARDQGHDLTAQPIARAAYDRKCTLARLALFLDHRNPARVSKADAVRWKEDFQRRGLAVATMRNDLSEMSAIWKWAIRNGKLAGNPFDGISPPKERGNRRQRRAFTEAEAVTILTAARSNTGFMRWLPWVCCLTGARISEICQSTKEDVKSIEGVAVLRITDEGDMDVDSPRSLKNEDSRRNVPMHPALIAEGFLDYVNALPARSALFPDARPDRVFGVRATNAGKKVSRWLKKDLKITDIRISPNHSWRHWFIGECRRIGMHPEVRSALTGHSARMDESAMYGDGMKSFVRLLADNVANIKAPVAPSGSWGNGGASGGL